MECMRDNFEDGQVIGGRFKAISPLNHGSFGMVFMARDLVTKNNVAVKCLTKRSAADAATSMFAVDEQSEELACHGRLGSHPNIVNLIHSFETDAHIYLVLEFCSRGDLYEAIRTGCGPLETEHVREFMLQLVDAIAYIHSKGMYHRDIKPENIFLTQDGTLKLGDFGLATKDTWSYETTVGSDRYMSPEQYDSAGAGYSPAQADIWAVGICLLNILFSRNPFTTPTESDLLFLDYSRDNQSLFDVFPAMSQDTFQIITHCMSLDPRKRSLSAVRAAIVSAVTFTTFDEELDDFCAASPGVLPTPASANREPLRTPSVQSPHVDQGTFPWAKALHASPPQAMRQLSVIEDTESYDEELFPSSEESNKDWFSVSGQSPSIASILNSSIGPGFQSMAIRRPNKINGPPRPGTTQVSGSLPISMIKPKPIPSMASIFKSHDTVSKSWSDMWEEEEEEEQLDQGIRARQEMNSRTWSHESTSGDTETPRQGLTESNPSFVNIRSMSPAKASDVDDDLVNDGFFFHDASPARQESPPRYSPPSKRSAVDKWSALGERRRAATTDKSAEQWRERRAAPTHNNDIVHTNYTFANLGSSMASANVKGNGAHGISSASSLGAWDLWGKDRVTGASSTSTATTKHNSFYDNIRLGGQAPSRAKDCPWARSRGRSTASPRKELGDLEWVGGWSDEHALTSLQL